MSLEVEGVPTRERHHVPGKRDLGLKKIDLGNEAEGGVVLSVLGPSERKNRSWEELVHDAGRQVKLSSMTSITWLCSRSFSIRESMRSPLIQK